MANKRKLKERIDQLQSEIDSLAAGPLAKQLAEAQEALQAAERTNRVQQVEIDSLASVIARDRQRTLAETAIASRTIAESEGRATK